MKNIHYYLAFSHFLGIGPLRFTQLVGHYKSVKKAYGAPLSELKELIGPGIATKFDEFRNKFKPEEKLKELSKKEIKIITQDDRLFPSTLLNISDPPICLYVKGDIESYDFEKEFFFAVVGTRRASVYGQQIARRFSRELIESGAIIVSGMALGIDTTAHETAISMKARTIAVLGCGVDIVYPPQNKRLYEQIIATGGLVMSEFPPGMMVKPGLFVARNRLVSGLSKGVFVVEGTKKSGALITARYAALQGKDVFAPPVPLTSSLSEAPNILLKQGAVLVTSIEDILNEFNIKPFLAKKQNEMELPEDEKNIFCKLSVQAYTADDLALECHIGMQRLLPILSTMEIKGIIEKNIEGKFQIRQ